MCQHSTGHLRYCPVRTCSVEPTSPALVGGLFTTEPPEEHLASARIPHPIGQVSFS